jgi:hypothetical protein
MNTSHFYNRFTVNLWSNDQLVGPCAFCLDAESEALSLAAEWAEDRAFFNYSTVTRTIVSKVLDQCDDEGNPRPYP